MRLVTPGQNRWWNQNFVEKYTEAQRGVFFRVRLLSASCLSSLPLFTPSEGLLFSHLETSYGDRKIVGVLFKSVGHVP